MNNLALLQLLTISNPNLPIGGFTYSQGIESAIENKWIQNEDDAYNWILEQLKIGITYTDLAILWQLNLAYSNQNVQLADKLNAILLACRESKELRNEEINRGKAFFSLLNNLDLKIPNNWLKMVKNNHLLGYVLYANLYKINIQDVINAYAWGWIENQVLSVVKILPLGQNAGQKLLHKLLLEAPKTLEKISKISIDEIGLSQFSLAIISSKHETQWSRIFRS
jgi:urease accessory protein